jgi:DNA repair exonuclease SbcCD ATPase subunit
MKTLKLTLIVTAFLALSSLTNAQSSFDKLYEKYSTQEGFTSVNISKELFQMFASMGDQKDTSVREMKKVMNQLNSLKVLNCKPDSMKPGKASAFFNEATALFNNAAYKELMTVNDDGNAIRFLTKQDGNGKITELVMTVKGKEEIVVLDMTGLIDLSTVSRISKSMNIHGMDKLRNVPTNKK